MSESKGQDEYVGSVGINLFYSDILNRYDVVMIKGDVTAVFKVNDFVAKEIIEFIDKCKKNEDISSL